jgi:hypothetical protein
VAPLLAGDMQTPLDVAYLEHLILEKQELFRAVFTMAAALLVYYDQGSIGDTGATLRTTTPQTRLDEIEFNLLKPYLIVPASCRFIFNLRRTKPHRLGPSW